MSAAFMVPPIANSVRSLNRPPVIRPFLVVQLPDTGNMRGMVVCLCPINCRFLSAKSTKHLVALGLDHIIINARPFWPSLWPSLHVNICHYGSPLPSDLAWEEGQRISYKRKSRRSITHLSTQKGIILSFKRIDGNL
jgi:hypothetical protein